MSMHRVSGYIRSLLFLSILTLFACAPAKTVFNAPVDLSKAGDYEVIEIPNFTKTDQMWVPYDSYTQIPDMVVEELRTKNHFKEISRSDSSQGSAEKVLLVEGTVTGYSRGCKFCEWFLRLNDKGKSSVSVRVKLIDKTTGELLRDASIEARAAKPGYGKSRYVRIVDEIVDLIQGVNKGEES